ncbi:hypothetical protein D3C73_1238070 [compost metagenome]
MRGFDIVAVEFTDDDEIAAARVQGNGGAGRGVARAYDSGHVGGGGGLQEGVLYRATILRLQFLHDVQGARHQHGFAVVILWRGGAGINAEQIRLVLFGKRQRQCGAAVAIESVVQVDGNASVHGGPPWYASHVAMVARSSGPTLDARQASITLCRRRHRLLTRRFLFHAVA